MITSAILKNPIAIVMSQNANGVRRFEQDRIKGDFVRCHPSSGRHVAILASLIHRDEKHAPADGTGILVRLDVFRRYFKN